MNETVTVTVVDEAGDTVSFVVPAYNRSLSELSDVVTEHLSNYLTASSKQGEPVSLGDFCLWLIRNASYEPRS